MTRSVPGEGRPAATGARRRGVLGRAGLVAGLLVAGQVVLLPDVAHAATILTVTTTADISQSAGACGNSSITTAPSPLSPARSHLPGQQPRWRGHHQRPGRALLPANGELPPGTAGQNITIVGAGSASTIIDGNNASRVFDIDAASVGGVDRQHQRV